MSPAASVQSAQDSFSFLTCLKSVTTICLHDVLRLLAYMYSWTEHLIKTPSTYNGIMATCPFAKRKTRGAL